MKEEDVRDYEGPLWRVQEVGERWNVTALRGQSGGGLGYSSGEWAIFENREENLRLEGRCARCERGDERVQHPNGTYGHPYQDRWMETRYHGCLAADAVAAFRASRERVSA